MIHFKFYVLDLFAYVTCANDFMRLKTVQHIKTSF